MKRFSLVLVVLTVFALLLTGCTKNEATEEGNAEFNYRTAEEVKANIENNDDIILLDIQPEDAWEEHHIQGAIPTHAYPVETDEDKAKFDGVMSDLESSEDPIIIICPGGKKGAERTYNYLIEKGIKEDRLFILENGQGGWPYDELLEK
ncbi:rhodanese-like domain-containing protein [Anaerosalibacter sp. Marseille-P3206]|uniref:rhodanese-like domain-containing protein n=1 Tax=Anaerosalibacter sp. Marseille-P3206 TaxID=1871005 RepID=UPI000987502C|nr:rhodanese-like domain-containing protein [Anaerosalibacter sp. Marseille-P3206]